MSTARYANRAIRYYDPGASPQAPVLRKHPRVPRSIRVPVPNAEREQRAQEKRARRAAQRRGLS